MPFTPFVSDIFGRRIALIVGSLIMCVGVAIQAASTNVPMFTGARFTGGSFNLGTAHHELIHLTVGFGLSFAQNASPLLLTELAYPTQVREGHPLSAMPIPDHRLYSVEGLPPCLTPAGIWVAYCRRGLVLAHIESQEEVSGHGGPLLFCKPSARRHSFLRFGSFLRALGG